MRNRQIVRQWEILRRLARCRGNSLRGLAGDFGVCPRTIARDIAALEEAGFPIITAETETGLVDWRLINNPFAEIER